MANTDVHIPPKMLEALCGLEGWCIGKGIEEVDEKFVRDFLLDREGKRMANNFKPEYLYP